MQDRVSKSLVRKAKKSDTLKLVVESVWGKKKAGPHDTCHAF
jgi:hypothetical protein